MSATSQSNLEGQRPLVTDATPGIGRAVALQLACDGAEVVVHRRDDASVALGRAKLSVNSDATQIRREPRK
jgi:NAD(P)-dependent dehydrogenase (short-subunit alcohol dehydrogenase family)